MLLEKRKIAKGERKSRPHPTHTIVPAVNLNARSQAHRSPPFQENVPPSPGGSINVSLEGQEAVSNKRDYQ